MLAHYHCDHFIRNLPTYHVKYNDFREVTVSTTSSSTSATPNIPSMAELLKHFHFIMKSAFSNDNYVYALP